MIQLLIQKIVNELLLEIPTTRQFGLLLRVEVGYQAGVSIA